MARLFLVFRDESRDASGHDPADGRLRRAERGDGHVAEAARAERLRAGQRAGIGLRPAQSLLDRVAVQPRCPPRGRSYGPLLVIASARRRTVVALVVILR